LPEDEPTTAGDGAPSRPPEPEPAARQRAHSDIFHPELVWAALAAAGLVRSG
jgi:hypothetical protein